MPRVSLFSAMCARCESTFAWPVLPDMSYGELILTGERGTVHAYACLVENPAFEFISSLLGPGSPTEQIHESLARAADPIDGQRLTANRVCPVCRSREWKYWAGDFVGMADLPDASFDEFLRLSETLRRERVLGSV